MIFIFDFNFCPDDEEKFAANARNYELLRTHIIIIIDFKKKKKYQFLARRRCRNLKKKPYIHINY